MSSGLPGDINHDGRVTIDEIQKAINCYLGFPYEYCSDFDFNNDGQVTIDELQKVINSFLHGGDDMSGYVSGPSSSMDGAIALFNGTTGDLIKNSNRLIEDVFGDGENIPDSHAIKAYGDANWGDLWTDQGDYYYPNNWSYLRIYDAAYEYIADSTSYANGFPWDDGVPYPGSNKGSMLSIGQTSDSDGNPPVWVQKVFNKSSNSATHYAGAGHFEVLKQSGATLSYVSALTGFIQQEAASGDAIGIHGRARKKGDGNIYAGWFYADRPSGYTGGYCHGIEVDLCNNGGDTGFSDTVGSSADIGIWAYSQNSGYPSLAAIGIGADDVNYSHHNGILFSTNAVRNDGVGINLYSVSPAYGIKFSSGSTANLYYADTGDGLRIKSLGHTFSINSGNGSWYWRTSDNSGDAMLLNQAGDLNVAGNITAGGTCCDYVLNGEYSLMTLDDLIEYIKHNSRLPGICKKGVSFANLYEKVEEGTLYILQLYERIKRLETTINKVSK